MPARRVQNGATPIAGVQSNPCCMCRGHGRNLQMAETCKSHTLRLGELLQEARLFLRSNLKRPRWLGTHDTQRGHLPRAVLASPEHRIRLLFKSCKGETLACAAADAARGVVLYEWPCTDAVTEAIDPRTRSFGNSLPGCGIPLCAGLGGGCIRADDLSPNCLLQFAVGIAVAQVVPLNRLVTCLFSETKAPPLHLSPCGRPSAVAHAGTDFTRLWFDDTC